MLISAQGFVLQTHWLLGSHFKDNVLRLTFLTNTIVLEGQEAQDIHNRLVEEADRDGLKRIQRALDRDRDED